MNSKNYANLQRLLRIHLRLKIKEGYNSSIRVCSKVIKDQIIIIICLVHWRRIKDFLLFKEEDYNSINKMEIQRNIEIEIKWKQNNILSCEIANAN